VVAPFRWEKVTVSKYNQKVDEDEEQHDDLVQFRQIYTTGTKFSASAFCLEAS
jgi:hypothetical protein